MKLCTAVTLVGVLVGLSSPASGQVAELHPAPSVLFRSEPTTVGVADSLNIRPTYWKEGALIGAGVGALFGVYVGVELCRSGWVRDSECVPSTILSTLLFGAVAAVPGAFIGGQFPKSE